MDPVGPELTACFEQKIAAWFAGAGRRTIADRVRLRQMNVALALALSRWLDFAEREEALPAMRGWLREIEARAVARGAVARAEAIRRASEWFESCASGSRAAVGPSGFTPGEG